jgi:hypothetical protein
MISINNILYYNIILSHEPYVEYINYSISYQTFGRHQSLDLD